MGGGDTMLGVMRGKGGDLWMSASVIILNYSAGEGYRAGGCLELMD